jgi:isopentenyl-diphosphate Delta-isomerase
MQDKGRQPEQLVMVDDHDNIIGHDTRLALHSGSGRLHRAVSVFVQNQLGEVLLQRRSVNKMLWPGVWSTSCCGHPRRGEEYDDAAYRRVKEELGMTLGLQRLFTFSYFACDGTRGSEREICAVYIGVTEMRPVTNRAEIAAWKYVSAARLGQLLNRVPRVFTPWLHLEWELILSSFPEFILNPEGGKKSCEV